MLLPQWDPFRYWNFARLLLLSSPENGKSMNSQFLIFRRLVNCELWYAFNIYLLRLAEWSKFSEHGYDKCFCSAHLRLVNGIILLLVFANCSFVKGKIALVPNPGNIKLKDKRLVWACTPKTRVLNTGHNRYQCNWSSTELYKSSMWDAFMPPYLPQKVTMSRVGEDSKTAFDPGIPSFNNNPYSCRNNYCFLVLYSNQFSSGVHPNTP